MRWACLMMMSGLLLAQNGGRALKGVSLGQSEQQVRKALTTTADFQKEDEGQQVWKLRDDAQAQYVFVGFDAEKRVRYVTVMAKPKQSIPCAPLGEGPSVQRRGKAGNYEFMRKLDIDEVVLAKGPDADHLLFCSLKKLQAKGEEQD